MYEIKITVAAPEIADAIHHLANAIEAEAQTSAGAIRESVNAVNNMAKAVTANTATKKNDKEPAPAETPTPAPAPAPVAPVAPPTQVQSAAPAPAPTAPAPAPAVKALTLNDISNAGAELVDRGMMPQLVELLGRYGVQTVLMLKPEQYSAFAVELRALGANI